MTDWEAMIAWVRAQLADDEQVAQEAMHSDAVRPGEWITEHHNSRYHDEPNRCHIAEDRSGHYWTVASEVYIPVAEHMASWDPARTLALVAGFRKILDEFKWEAQELRAIRIMTEALYAARPGYREEWRP